jgi:hypothetical protein
MRRFKVSVSNPGDFMDYTKLQPALVNDPEYVITRKLSESTVLVQTAYGWFWIDGQFESFSDEFFATEEMAKSDLFTFRKSNSFGARA